MRNGPATRASRFSSSSITRKAARARCCTAIRPRSSSSPRSSARRRFAARHLSMESIYEYGSRAGVWRILREFERRRLPLTVFGVAMALERNPEVDGGVRRARPRDRLPRLALDPLPERRRGDRARAHADRPSTILRALTGDAPLGWYTGRDSPNTRRLVVEHGGFLYDSDYYGDDLPFWTEVTTADGATQPHLVVPYTLDTNDMRFATPQGFNTGEQFFAYLRDAFDVLYAEGDRAPEDAVDRHALPAARAARPLRRAAAFPRSRRTPRPGLGLPPRRHRAALDRAASPYSSRGSPRHDDASRSPRERASGSAARTLARLSEEPGRADPRVPVPANSARPTTSRWAGCARRE